MFHNEATPSCMEMASLWNIMDGEQTMEHYGTSQVEITFLVIVWWAYFIMENYGTLWNKLKSNFLMEHYS